MKNHFQILNVTRENIISSISSLSLDELNKVPEQFSNNIIWNIGHLVATQQLLCYKLSSVAMYIDDDFINRYKKGSKVDFKVTQEEVDYILDQLKELPTLVESDYSNGKFKSYQPYTTSYKITLNTIEEAIQFNNVHEGLHFGYIMAMKKIVTI